jgi:hypothetical protein
MRTKMFFRALWVVLLAISVAGVLPGKAIGTGMGRPHLQDMTNLYLPIIISQSDNWLYLPVIYKQIAPDIANPGFEQGYTGWVFNSNQGIDLITQAQANTGLYSASLANGNNYRVASISQNLMVPSSRSMLTFWIYINSADVCGWDYLKFYINSQLFYTYDICSGTSTYQWTFQNMDLSGFSNQAITLMIEYTSDISLASYVYLDDFQFTWP